MMEPFVLSRKLLRLTVSTQFMSVHSLCLASSWLLVGGHVMHSPYTNSKVTTHAKHTARRQLNLLLVAFCEYCTCLHYC